MADPDHRKDFWDRLEDCRTGLLDIDGRAVPMSPSLEPEDGNIWFLTAKGTEMAEAAAAGKSARFLLCNEAQSLYAQVEGSLSVSTDQKKLDEVWSLMASAWFEEGKQDPDLVLMLLKPAKAEVWLGPKSGIKFLWGIARAKVTGEEPDYGDHFSLTF